MGDEKRAVALATDITRSLASLQHLPSPAKVRSTTQSSGDGHFSIIRGHRGWDGWNMYSGSARP